MLPQYSTSSSHLGKSELPPEPTCDCHNTAIRAKLASNGVTHFVRQCLSCGRNLGAVPKATTRVPDLIEPFDDLLRERWDNQYRQFLDARRQAKEREWQERDTDWWRQYDAYLLTPEWREKRDRVLRRDKNLCQGCFARPAITAHHLTYEHVSCEFLFELVAVCAECHNRLHSERSAKR